MAVARAKEAPAPVNGAPPSPDSNLGWLLAQAAHALATELTAALEALNVTPRGHCVLSVALTGAHTQKQLAEAIGLDKTTMVVTLDALEEAGLAERVPSETDRRARVIRVTSAGKRLVTQGERVVEDIQAEVLASLPGRQREQLVDALSSLVHGRLSTPATCEGPVRRRSQRYLNRPDTFRTPK